MSCNNFENTSDENAANGDKTLTIRESTYTETYSINGQLYTLIFPENSDTPLNTEVETQLIGAIGNSEYILAHYEETPNVTFIEPVPPASCPSTNEMQPPPAGSPPPAPTAIFLELFEHTNFQGRSFGYYHGPNYYNQFWQFKSCSWNGSFQYCSTAYGIQDLRDVLVFPSTDTWDDRISSFKIIRPSASLHPSQYMLLKMHRDPGYSSSKCRLSQWRVATTGNNYHVPNLSNEKWCFLGANMNDEISSISFSFCNNGCNCCVTF